MRGVLASDSGLNGASYCISQNVPGAATKEKCQVAHKTQSRRFRKPESAGLTQAAMRGCYPLPMRYIFVPQTGQAPLVAGLPFFMVTGFGSFMSRCVRHFRQ
jgi:hypothetical protein